MVDGRWLMRSWICWIDDFLNFLVNPPFDSKKKRHLLQFLCFSYSPFKWPWDVMDGHGLRSQIDSAAILASVLAMARLVGWTNTAWASNVDQLFHSHEVRLHLHSRNKTRSLFLVLRKPAVVIKTTRLAPFREIRNPRQQGMPGTARLVSLGTCFKPRQRQPFVVILVKQ